MYNILLSSSRSLPSAAELVQQLAEHITGFQDQGLFIPEAPTGATSGSAAAAAEGEQSAAAAAAGAPFEVVFLRKAQCLAADLLGRLGEQEAQFKWADAQQLTADTSERGMGGGGGGTGAKGGGAGGGRRVLWVG